MNQTELDECFEFVHLLVLKCGDVFREGFKDCGYVTNKGAYHDLVTFYDGEIEKILVDGIKTKYPSHKFIAEEDSATSKKELILTDEPTWIIDPIDGTINFVKQLHFVCISAALVVDKDLKIAFLYNPTLNEMFTAKKGQGAFLNGKQIFVSKNEEMQKCLFACEISLGSVQHLQAKLIERTKALLRRCLGIRSLGSAALTLGYVAKGAIDGYNIENLKPWDIAAGALMVQEAGGIVIDKNGGPINIMKPDIIAAGTLKIAQELLEMISQIDQRLEAEG